jgi:8-hydroxy-5-deazaflavin:NADPH oxidoreductase
VKRRIVPIEDPGEMPAFIGDATATATVDGLLPLWFALVRQNGGNRKVALRIVR